MIKTDDMVENPKSYRVYFIKRINHIVIMGDIWCHYQTEEIRDRE